MRYGLALLLGAFWLFFVQPMLGKAIVPWFGGGANVWITCLVFFQAMLLTGYAYAHLLATRLRLKQQQRIHFSVLAAAFLVTLALAKVSGSPFQPPAFLKPTGGEEPAIRILLILGVTVGLPFVALAATSPLLQAWHARAHPDRPAYRLFAMSNAGSFLGLLLYPFGAEILLSRQAQGWLSLGVFLGAALCITWVGSRMPRSTEEGPASPAEARETDGTPEGGPASYVGLAALGSAILAGGTAFLASHVATIPLLWVLPLGAYLLSFIVCFESGLDLRGRWGLLVLVGLLAAQGLTPLVWNRGFHVPGILLVLLVVFFSTTLVHGRLYSLRPEAGGLTRFYLFVSLGGVLGGTLGGVLAPVLFKNVTEFHLSLLLTCCVGWWLGRPSPGTWTRTLRLVSVLAGCVILYQFQAIALDPRVAYRDFYGPMRVEWLAPGIKKLTHAGTAHGIQLMDRPGVPLAYFGPGSGLDRAWKAQREKKQHLRIGIVGLGVGNAVGYAQAGDQVVVYEISRLVIDLSGPTQPKEFTILEKSPARVEVIAGDGRLSLDRDFQGAGSRGFDLLMIDAFSGGNVPWHLLTVEAMEGMKRHLAPGGIIAFHVTNNRRVDLLVLAAAGNAGLWSAPVQQSRRLRLQGSSIELTMPSTYVLLSQAKEPLLHPAILDGAELVLAPRRPGSGTPTQADPSPRYPLKMLRNLKPWTDDRNCLSELLWLGR